MVVENNGSGITSGDSRNRPEANSGATNKKRESVPRMAPLLSRRSIIILGIGLVIGIVGGLGYWLISPSLNSAEPIVQEDTAPLMWGDYKGLYESTVQVQIVNPGSSYVSLGDLQRTAEYYAAKANSFPFLDFLSREIDENAPLFSHTAEELERVISIRHNSDSEVPLIEIRATSATKDEALYLTAFVPIVFKDFLASEEDELRLQEYELLVEDIDGIKQRLLEAEQELATSALENTTSIIENDPTYISLAAKVVALEAELNLQASQLATLIAIGDQSQTYLDAVAAVEKTSIALAEAKSELAVLEAQHNIEYTGQNLDYQIAKARVDNLSREIASLTDRMTSLLTGNGDRPTTSEYIVIGTPSAPIPAIDRIRGRDAILLGSILGVGVAWVILNFRWLAKGMPSSSVRRREEEEEEEMA